MGFSLTLAQANNDGREDCFYNAGSSMMHVTENKEDWPSNSVAIDFMEKLGDPDVAVFGYFDCSKNHKSAVVKLETSSEDDRTMTKLCLRRWMATLQRSQMTMMMMMMMVMMMIPRVLWQNE